MTKKAFALDLYMLLAVLYALKSILYTRGTLFSQSISGLFVVLTVVLAIAAFFTTKMPKVLKSYLIFVCVLTFYGVVLYSSHEIITVQYTGAKTGGSQYIEAILYSNLPIFSVYYLAKKNYYSLSHLKVWVFILFLVSIVSYYHQQSLVLENRIGGQFEDEITNNEAYLFVALLPMLCLFEKQRLVQYIGIAVCFVFLLWGIKRGALLTGIVEIFALLYYNLRNATRIKKTYFFLLSAILIAGGYFLFQKMLDTSDYFAFRYQLTLEGYSSGRDIITSQILNYFQTQMSIGDMFFGRGALATVKMFVNYAHNDWLELMVCQGILGVLLYLFFYIYLVKASIKAKESMTKISLILIFIALFLPTLFSMTYNTVSFSLACYFGFIAARIND